MYYLPRRTKGETGSGMKVEMTCRAITSLTGRAGEIEPLRESIFTRECHHALARDGAVS